MKVIRCPTHDFTYIFVRITVMQRQRETESNQSYHLPIHTNVKITHVDSSSKEGSATFPATVYQGRVTMQQPFCTRMAKHEFCLLLPICRLVCVTTQHTHVAGQIRSSLSHLADIERVMRLKSLLHGMMYRMARAADWKVRGLSSQVRRSRHRRAKNQSSTHNWSWHRQAASAGHPT